jgi:hypothetical protein
VRTRARDLIRIRRWRRTVGPFDMFPTCPVRRSRIGINQLVRSRETQRRTPPNETLNHFGRWARCRCLTCSESLRVRRLRLGAPKFLFHSDRIDQIAAATAVASTDRSKEEKAFPKLTLNPNLLNQ